MKSFEDWLNTETFETKSEERPTCFYCDSTLNKAGIHIVRGEARQKWRCTNCKVSGCIGKDKTDYPHNHMNTTCTDCGSKNVHSWQEQLTTYPVKFIAGRCNTCKKYFERKI